MLCFAEFIALSQSCFSLVGDSFFSPMAELYWDEHPPGGRSMTMYGACFADHIASYGPAVSLGYLPDIARLDRAWLEAHHAGECEVLIGAAVAAMKPDALPALRPGLHPSVRLVELDWPVFEVWAAHRAGRALAPTEIVPGAQHVLVWRQNGQIVQLNFSAGHHAFVTALGEGASLESAVAHAATMPGDEDPASFFGHALSHGLLAIPASP